MIVLGFILSFRSLIFYTSSCLTFSSPLNFLLGNSYWSKILLRMHIMGLDCNSWNTWFSVCFWRLKALVAIPKVSGPCAIAIGKVYPSMRSLLKVYLDKGKTVSFSFSSDCWLHTDNSLYCGLALQVGNHLHQIGFADQDREKEMLLEDIKRESIFGSTAGQRIGAVCSKQIYRVLMAQNGNVKVDQIDQETHEEWLVEVL